MKPELTEAALAELMRGLDVEPPADLRERLRKKLHALPEVARDVYPRDSIADPETPLLRVVETVLYHFDGSNRRKVSQALALDYDPMLCLLCGYVIGRGG